MSVVTSHGGRQRSLTISFSLCCLSRRAVERSPHERRRIGSKGLGQVRSRARERPSPSGPRCPARQPPDFPSVSTASGRTRIVPGVNFRGRPACISRAHQFDIVHPGRLGHVGHIRFGQRACCVRMAVIWLDAGWTRRTPDHVFPGLILMPPTTRSRLSRDPILRCAILPRKSL